MSLQRVFVATAKIIGLLILTSSLNINSGNAASRKITPIKMFEGQTRKRGTDDLSRYLLSDMQLQEFWKNWAIEDPRPSVNFKDQFVLFYLSNGGPHLLELNLEDNGNLKAVFVSTPIWGPLLNYLIVIINRTGIKSVNGSRIEKK